MKKSGSGNPEAETIINYNKADVKDGYFHVWTSIPSHAKRILNRVDKNLIIDLKIGKKNGVEDTWSFKLPAKLFFSGIVRKKNSATTVSKASSTSRKNPTWLKGTRKNKKNVE